MLLAAFRLSRDKHTERDSFGYTRQRISKIRQEPSVYSPLLGCSIEIPTTIKSNIVKMVELYNRQFGVVVVERLGWMFGKDIYPYKARYINIDKTHSGSDVDILFLDNMTKIHKNLSGTHCSFYSPIQYHVNSQAQPWHNNHAHGNLNCLADKYRNWMGSFAYAHDHWGDTERFIDHFDNGPVPFNVENLFKDFILPRPPIRDPFTIHNHNKPISAYHLSLEKGLLKPFDVTPPQELTINHPEKTIYSPKVSQMTIDNLDQIALQFSDVNFEYILSGTTIASVKQNYLISRYRNTILENVDADRDCRWVIISVFEIIYREFPNIKLFDEVRVNFVMSYGEEVLIEFFDYTTNECLGAIHFDLAMLSLCALCIAVGVDPF